jgi:hypothetical protein
MADSDAETDRIRVWVGHNVPMPKRSGLSDTFRGDQTIGDVCARLGGIQPGNVVVYNRFYSSDTPLSQVARDPDKDVTLYPCYVGALYAMAGVACSSVLLYAIIANTWYPCSYDESKQSEYNKQAWAMDAIRFLAIVLLAIGCIILSLARMGKQDMRMAISAVGWSSAVMILAVWLWSLIVSVMASGACANDNCVQFSSDRADFVASVDTMLGLQGGITPAGAAPCANEAAGTPNYWHDPSAWCQDAIEVNCAGYFGPHTNKRAGTHSACIRFGCDTGFIKYARAAYWMLFGYDVLLMCVAAGLAAAFGMPAKHPDDKKKKKQADDLDDLRTSDTFGDSSGGGGGAGGSVGGADDDLSAPEMYTIDPTTITAEAIGPLASNIRLRVPLSRQHRQLPFGSTPMRFV